MPNNENPLNSTHLQNLVISITEKNDYKMLFPGDAGCELLQLICWDNNEVNQINVNHLKGTRFLLANHHASIKSNEDRWLSYIMSHGCGFSNALTCIISASPDYAKYGAPSAFWLDIFPKFYRCAEHDITLCGPTEIYKTKTDVLLLTTYDQGYMTLYPLTGEFEFE